MDENAVIGSEYDYMAPKHSTDYQTKPLPMVPPQRSTGPSINSQVNNVSRSSNRSHGNRQPGRNWERDVDDVANMWDHRMGTGQNRNMLKINAKDIPTTPPDEILSPQPRQCVQKILKLTGKISPVASVSSSDLPTLHNSRQKIKQLTGFDVSAGGLDQSQSSSLQSPQDDFSPISLRSSWYSQEDLETAISEIDMESSDYSYRYRYSYVDDEYNDVATPLSPPNFGAFSTRPISAAPVSPTSIPAALRLSAFRERKDREVPYADDELWTSSRDSSPADRVVDLYHTTTSEIVKGDVPPLGGRSGASAFSPSPAASQRSTVWGETFQKTRFNLSSSSSSLPSTPIESRRKTESYSDRRFTSRNRVPPPLEQAREAPRPGRYTLPQRTPNPLPSPNLKSAFDEDDGQKRFSILSKVFGGSASNNNSKNRDSSGSRHMSVLSRKEDMTPGAVPIVPNYARKVEGPVTTWPRHSPSSTAAATSGRPVSAGLGVFQRTIESARQSVGLKTKAEKRRQSLKGMIRILKPGELASVAGAGSR